jgi:hypothetical protein
VRCAPAGGTVGLNTDANRCIYERYADSAAVMTHLRGFGEKFAGRFLAAVAPTRLTVFGAPSDQVKEALSAFGPTFLKPFGGFTR